MKATAAQLERLTVTIALFYISFAIVFSIRHKIKCDTGRNQLVQFATALEAFEH
jgi:hypothetical protein